MKQISTGTGLVVLSGTILASVFLSSPRTASTAFASAQQAQPAERSVGGNRGSNASMVVDCQSTESLQWFSSTPKVIQGCSVLGVVVPVEGASYGVLEADINNDGIREYFITNPFGDQKVYLSTIEKIGGIATSKLILLFSVDSQSINDYRSSVGLSSDGGWRLLGLRDCDNDGDLDLAIGSYEQSMYFENTGFQHTAPLEGDLNHDGHVDNTDVGLVLLNFDA
jgi:hypothetical protein